MIKNYLDPTKFTHAKFDKELMDLVDNHFLNMSSRIKTEINSFIKDKIFGFQKKQPPLKYTGEAEVVCSDTGLDNAPQCLLDSSRASKWCVNFTP